MSGKEACAKGAVLVEVVKALRRQMSVSKRLLNREHHHYLDGRIMPFAWYPEKDLHALQEVLAAILPRAEHGERYRSLGEHHAHNHRDIFQHILATGAPAEALQRIESLWRAQHNTGALSVSVSGINEVDICLKDFGAPSRLICQSMRGYFEGCILMAGGVDAYAVETECRLYGDRDCRWQVGWRNAAMLLAA